MEARTVYEQWEWPREEEIDLERGGVTLSTQEFLLNEIPVGQTLAERGLGIRRDLDWVELGWNGVGW